MRAAFVVQLGPETKPAEESFDGWVEEVDSSTILRFHTKEELLKFMGQRFELLVACGGEGPAAQSEEIAPKKKTLCKDKSRT